MKHVVKVIEVHSCRYSRLYQRLIPFMSFANVGIPKSMSTYSIDNSNNYDCFAMVPGYCLSGG